MDNGRIAAIFDVDGTLIAGDSLERIFFRFLWRRGELSWRDLLCFGVNAVDALLTGRSPFKANKAYLRSKNASRIRRLARECFELEIVRRLLPGALDRLRWHQSSGHFPILLSGTLDLLLEPLAEYLGVSARVGTELETEGRLFTGRIAGMHPFGEAKAESVRLMNGLGVFNLKRSFAYADSYADRYMLAQLGYPVATNADARLRRLAEKRGWMIEDFISCKTGISKEKTYDRF
jgi:HAD superfamily hydrolase (TIGR01490 family)